MPLHRGLRALERELAQSALEADALRGRLLALEGKAPAPVDLSGEIDDLHARARGAEERARVLWLMADGLRAQATELDIEAGELRLLAEALRRATMPAEAAYAPAGALESEAAAAGDLAADLRSYSAHAGAMVDQSSPAPPPFGWMGARGLKSRRGYNVGSMAISGLNLANWNLRMGFETEIIGGSCFVVANSATSLDAIVGGPESLGDQAVMWPSQANIRRIPVCADMLAHTNGVKPDTWIVPYITLAPFLCKLDLVEEIARGVHRSRFRQMGRRYAWQLTTAGHALDRFALRPNHECDQDTGCRIASVAASGSYQTGYWQACFNAGKTFDQAVQLYADWIGETIGAMREGYGQFFPIFWSPAHEATHVPSSYNGGILPYGRLLTFHDGACFSFHPDYRRTITPEAAAAGVFSTAIKRNTPQVALEAAIAQDKPLACLEHSGRHEIDFVTPNRDITGYPAAYAAFADFLDLHASRTFGVCGMGSPMVNPDYLATLTYPAGHALAGTRVYPDLAHPNVKAWADMVTIHRERIGRFKAVTAA